MLVGSVRGLKGQLVQQVSRGPAQTWSLNRVIQYFEIGLEIFKENTVQCPLFLCVSESQYLYSRLPHISGLQWCKKLKFHPPITFCACLCLCLFQYLCSGQAHFLVITGVKGSLLSSQLPSRLILTNTMICLTCSTSSSSC